MKKFFIFLLALSICLSTAGCSKTKDADDLDKEVLSYFPITEDIFYEYTGSGHQAATYQIYNTYINGSRAQRRVSPENSSPTTEVVEVADGEFRLVYGDTIKYHYENLTEAPAESGMVILKAPFKVGATWEVTDGATAEITGMDVDITVPYGTFKAMEVTTTMTSGIIQTDYYVKDIGMVQTGYTTGDLEIISRLENVSEDSAIVCQAEAFYPDFSTGEVSSQWHSVALRTNSDIIPIVDELLRAESPDGAYPPLLAAGNVLDVVTASNASALKLNLSKAVYDKEFASEEEENAALMCMAYTVGYMYGVMQVFIQVEDKPYNGQFVTLTEEDYFEIQYQ